MRNNIHIAGVKSIHHMPFAGMAIDLTSYADFAPLNFIFINTYYTLYLSIHIIPYIYQYILYLERNPLRPRHLLQT